MQIVRTGNAVLPLPLPPLNFLPEEIILTPKVSNRIDFFRYLDPFICLIGNTVIRMIEASLYIVYGISRILIAIHVVFCRIMYKPAFDPQDSSFIETINNFEKEVPHLQERIVSLEQNFWQEQRILISQDLKDLQQLNQKIDNSLNELQKYLQVLEKRTQPLPIQEQLIRATNAYQNLKIQINTSCERTAFLLMKRFDNILYRFTKGGVELPLEIRKELIEDWEILRPMIRSYLAHYPLSEREEELSSLFNNACDRICALDKRPVEDVQIGLKKPLKLSNIGNSCYIDASIQAIMCSETICDQLNNLLPLPIPPIAPRDEQAGDYNEQIIKYNSERIEYQRNMEDYRKRLAIQQELIQFIDVKKMNQGGRGYTSVEFILLLLSGGPSLFRLRDKIFTSRFHHEFEPINLYRQLDAASIVELLIDQLLTNCKFKMQEHATTAAFPGIEFLGPADEMTMLQVTLRHRYQKIDELIRFQIGKHVERENDPNYQRNFNPIEGKVFDQEQAAPFLDPENPVPARKVSEFHQWYHFKKLPPFMTLHFKRFINVRARPDQVPRLVKDSRAVDLPDDGIIDLTKYYDAPEGDQKQGRYEIKSYVVHEGLTLERGHYVAYVRLKDKDKDRYYYCNDLDANCYREITKREFFEHKDAYLVFLERLPDVPATCQVLN